MMSHPIFSQLVYDPSLIEPTPPLDLTECNKYISLNMENNKIHHEIFLDDLLDREEAILKKDLSQILLNKSREDNYLRGDDGDDDMDFT
jgi:hypothetical protein